MGHSDESSVPFLSDLENEYTVAEKPHILPQDSPKIIKSSRTQTCFWVFCIFVVTLLSNIATYLATYKFQEDLDKTCSRHTTQNWSQQLKFHDLLHLIHKLIFTGPILDGVDIKYETVRFNGSLFRNTIYRQDPSPEVDEAWYNLGTNCNVLPH